MNTTLNQGGSDNSGASGVSSSSETAAGASQASPAAASTAVPAATKPAETIGNAAQNSLKAAQAKIAARSKPGKTGTAAAAAATTTASTAAGQAAVSPAKLDAAGAGTAADGASTQAAVEGKPKEGATGAEAGDAGAGSTEAPKDWPQADRERFAKLPEDGRKLVMDQYQNMRAGLTRANESLARERDQLGVLNQTMRQHGAEPGAVSELVELSARFESDPQLVIQQLAQQKGLKVHFGDAPTPAADEGGIPEFKTTAEMVTFIENRALERVRKEQTAEQQRAAEQGKREARLTELRTQFTAAKKDIPDFGSYEQSVLDTLAKAPNLSVTQAYRLASYDALAATAGEVPALRAEISALKAEAEAARKRATAPPRAEAPGANGKANAAGESPGMRALARAQRKLSAQASQ
jgi:hypothetical protein